LVLVLYQGKADLAIDLKTADGADGIGHFDAACGLGFEFLQADDVSRLGF
jgi:hypothetical protein